MTLEDSGHETRISINHSISSFFQLILMKRGGQVIYSGPLGQNSQNLIKYFEVSMTSQQFASNLTTYICVHHIYTICMGTIMPYSD